MFPIIGEVVIRTNSFETTLTINAPLDTVHHYGEAASVVVTAVSSNSLFVNGTVPFISMGGGRVVLKPTSEVQSMYITGGQPIIALAPEVEIPSFSATPDLPNGLLFTVQTLSNQIDSNGNPVVDIIVSVQKSDNVLNTTATKNGTSVSVPQVVTTIISENNEALVKGVEEDLVKVAIKFAGGKGTETDPFLVSTIEQFRNIEDNKGSFFYYKVANGVKTLDAQGGKLAINLTGNFDGNGVTFNNVGSNLFNNVYGNKDRVIGQGSATIKNLTVNFKNSNGGVVSWNTAKNFLIENVTVHGNMEGSFNISSFIDYNPGNEYVVNTTLRNAYSDATIVITGSSAGGYIGHTYSAAGSNFIFEDTKFEGSIYSSSGKSAVNVISGSTNASGSVNVTIIEEGIQTITTLSAANVRYNQDKSFGITVEKVETDKYPSKYDVFETKKVAGATRAVAILTIGPNGNGTTYKGGYYSGDYMVDENLELNGEMISTINIKYFDITSNGNATTTTGLSADGTTFNIVNPSYNNVIGGASVRIIQYDNNNNILKITTWNITPQD